VQRDHTIEKLISFLFLCPRIGSCCKDLSFSEATAVSLRQALNEQMLHNDKLSKLLADETLEHRALRQAMEQKVSLSVLECE
jgi:hypothetical protein